MAQEEKRFLGEIGLPQLIELIKSEFAKLVHTHTKSDIIDLEVDTTLSSSSENPIQNQAVATVIDELSAGVAYIEITGTEEVVDL